MAERVGYSPSLFCHPTIFSATCMKTAWIVAISMISPVSTLSGDSDEGDRGSGLMVISVPGSNRSVVGAKRRWQLDFVESDHDRQACCC